MGWYRPETEICSSAGGRRKAGSGRRLAECCQRLALRGHCPSGPWANVKIKDLTPFLRINTARPLLLVIVSEVMPSLKSSCFYPMDGALRQAK
ncbi:hypothetical protein CH330_04785 [candidate division WOR-3 bacterium JGI_Cruoil_03_51_56]|uniref:Uncharacterized protein n=1 Tax=candidate division WOR-3 bacterium JGI_Cruoil_03_51_56 TaxID=1973747 RepID=A0A235BVF8_UNCW3|nr:MAG: hypothetical protein CH330_04785 [candidate division WOR-3 bacterium JGI_Cruoil_03_51_56]